MTVRSWRIVKSKHAAKALSGEGARKAGGRWNSPGVAVVYTAGSESLAILELLVHLQTESQLKRYVVFEVVFDHAKVLEVDARDLPRTWRDSPPSCTVQSIGDRWVADAASAVLRVPSVVVPTEWNYLLNLQHPDYAAVSVSRKQPARFDPRLIRGLRSRLDTADEGI